MRITGGKACRIRLLLPKNTDIRPSMDATRERVFNRIGSDLNKAVVFDCFAGNGAYGLEALSRGAAFCFFFEKSDKLIEVLRKNALSVCKSTQSELSECTKIVRTDVFKTDFSAYPIPKFIFFDPPYRFWKEKIDDLHRALTTFGMLFPSAVLVLEFPSQVIWSENNLWQPVRSFEVSHKINEPRIELFRTVVSS